MRKILVLVFIFFANYSSSQSMDTLMFRMELLDKLDRINELLSGENNPAVITKSPKYKFINTYGQNANVSLDLANTNNPYPNIYTTNIQFLYAHEKFTKKQEKYRSIVIGAVITCGNSDTARIDFAGAMWFDSKNYFVKFDRERIKPIEKNEMKEPFLNIYQFICKNN